MKLMITQAAGHLPFTIYHLPVVYRVSFIVGLLKSAVVTWRIEKCEWEIGAGGDW